MLILRKIHSNEHYYGVNHSKIYSTRIFNNTYSIKPALLTTMGGS